MQQFKTTGGWARHTKDSKIHRRAFFGFIRLGRRFGRPSSSLLILLEHRCGRCCISKGSTTFWKGVCLYAGHQHGNRADMYKQKLHTAKSSLYQIHVLQSNSLSKNQRHRPLGYLNALLT